MSYAQYFTKRRPVNPKWFSYLNDSTAKGKWMNDVVKDWDGHSPMDVAIVGVPYDGADPSRYHGVRLSPDAVRENLYTWCSNYDEDYDAEISGIKVMDCGNIIIADDSKKDESYSTIEKACNILFQLSKVLVVIGGDAGVTLPLATALIDPKKSQRRIGFVDFDSHYDNRDMPKPFTHIPSDFTRWLMEKEPVPIKPENMVQIGIHGFLYTKEYAEYQRRKGVTIFKPKDVRKIGISEVMRQALQKATNKVDGFYVHVDIDCIDQAFMAGTTFVGGLMPWDVMDGLVECAKHPLCRGILIAYLDPLGDPLGSTMKMGAEMVMHFLAGVASRKKLP